MSLWYIPVVHHLVSSKASFYFTHCCGKNFLFRQCWKSRALSDFSKGCVNVKPVVCRSGHIDTKHTDVNKLLFPSLHQRDSLLHVISYSPLNIKNIEI